MKYSRQREIIKRALKDSNNHPTAEDIYEDIHDLEPNISLATVYRNLNLMAEMGEIRKVKYQGTSDRFDPIVEEHFHFVCDKCGKVENLSIKTEFTKMDELIMDETGANVKYHDLIVYGVCKKCQQD